MPMMLPLLLDANAMGWQLFADGRIRTLFIPLRLMTMPVILLRSEGDGRGVAAKGCFLSLVSVDRFYCASLFSARGAPICLVVDGASFRHDGEVRWGHCRRCLPPALPSFFRIGCQLPQLVYNT